MPSRALRNLREAGPSPHGLDLDSSIFDVEVEEMSEEMAEELQDLRQMEQEVVGEIPSDLIDEDDLATYIDEELNLAEAERSGFVRRLAEWQEAYEAPPADSAKNWPIRNAANLTLPVIKEVVNTLVSSLLQTLIVPTPTWIIQDIAEEWSPFTSLLQKFMDIGAKRDLEFDDKVENWILEGTKYGTSVVEVGHEFIKKRQYIYTEDGTRAVPEDQVDSGPRLWNIRLQDFYIPFHSISIQEAPWVAKKLRFNSRQLKERVRSSKFRKEAVANILEARLEDKADEVQEKHEEMEKTEPIERVRYPVFEVWLSWNLDDGDDAETEILAYWSPETMEFLSIRFNPFWHGERPFSVFKYFPVENRFYGQGICGQLEELQDEISTIHNQRIDNASMANLRMILTRKMSTSLMPGDPLYTGKIIEVDNLDDIAPFQLSEIYGSTIQNEQITRGYVERLSGVDETQSVGGQPVTRTTATAQALLLQEGRKRFDQTIRNARDGVSRVGRLVLRTYFQFGAGEKPILWLGKKGQVLKGVFNLPKIASEQGLGIEAAAPTSKLNKEAQRQNSLALFNLMVQLYEKFLQLTSQVSPQAVPLVSGALVQAAKQFMFDVLEQFDVTNPEDVLVGLTVLERVLPSAEDFGGMEAFEGREETAQILNELERLESTLREEATGPEGRSEIPSLRGDLRRVLQDEGVLGGGGENGRTSTPPTTGPGGEGAGAFGGAPRNRE